MGEKLIEINECKCGGESEEKRRWGNGAKKVAKEGKRSGKKKYFLNFPKDNL